MRNRGRMRRCGRRLSAPGRGGLLPPPGQQVLTVADNGSGAIRVTTAAAHGLTGGVDQVVLSGTSVAGYNGTPDFVTDVDADTFDLESIPYTADATGGRWDPV